MPTEHRTAVDLVTRAMPVTSVNADARTAQVVFSTGAAVRRRDWMTGAEYSEELEISAAAIDMTRLQAGAPLLNTHGAYSLQDVLGVIESAGVERGQAVATVRFSARDEVEPIFRDVRDGIIRNVSVGYSVQTWRVEKAAEGRIERRIATRWTPHEISLVPIGADPAAGVRSGAPSLERTAMQPQDNEVRAPAQAAGDAGEILTRERERVARIQELVDIARKYDHLPRARQAMEAAIRNGTSVEAARHQLLNMMAEFSEATSTRSGAALPEYVGGGFSGSTEDPTFRRALMAEALAARLGGPAPSEAARQFVGVRLMDLARDLLEHRGERTQYMSQAEVLTRAMHTTGDFPQLLSATGNRLLRRAYDTAPSLRRLARRATAPDFRPISRLQLSGSPIPVRQLEGGELKYGTMTEGRESYSVAIHARGLRISRQALINDDLSAFDDMSKFGRAAAEGESIYIVNLLTSGDPYTAGPGNGPTMGDNIALFNAAHGGNLLSGGGTALTAAGGVAAISAARTVMRLQRDLDGRTPINAEPRYLLVPAALETVAQQLVTQLTPNQVTQANPFSNLEVVVDPRLDAASATAWYLMADPALIDTIEFSYLDGFEGPTIETKVEFDYEGVSMKVRNEFGAGILDWRGMVRNTGA